MPALVPIELRPIPIVYDYEHGGIVRAGGPDFKDYVDIAKDALLHNSCMVL